MMNTLPNMKLNSVGTLHIYFHKQFICMLIGNKNIYTSISLIWMVYSNQMVLLKSTTHLHSVKEKKTEKNTQTMHFFFQIEIVVIVFEFYLNVHKFFGVTSVYLEMAEFQKTEHRNFMITKFLVSGVMRELVLAKKNVRA